MCFPSATIRRQSGSAFRCVAAIGEYHTARTARSYGATPVPVQSAQAIDVANLQERTPKYRSRLMSIRLPVEICDCESVRAIRPGLRPQTVVNELYEKLERYRRYNSATDQWVDYLGAGPDAKNLLFPMELNDLPKGTCDSQLNRGYCVGKAMMFWPSSSCSTQRASTPGTSPKASATKLGRKLCGTWANCGKSRKIADVFFAQNILADGP